MTVGSNPRLAVMILVCQHRCLWVSPKCWTARASINLGVPPGSTCHWNTIQNYVKPNSITLRKSWGSITFVKEIIFFCYKGFTRSIPICLQISYAIIFLIHSFRHLAPGPRHSCYAVFLSGCRLRVYLQCVGKGFLLREEWADLWTTPPSAWNAGFHKPNLFHRRISYEVSD